MNPYKLTILNILLGLTSINSLCLYYL